ncbi:MAG TPA: hypothetical protein VGA37_15080 [Gemmatimonadales bacterium]
MSDTVTGEAGAAKGGDQRATLSRELSDFLIQLSIALHRYAMYPAGHPSLGPMVDNLLNHLTELVQTRDSLSLGVARSQLVIEGVATDPKNAVLKDLASRMHRHHLGAVTFRKGAGHHEVHQLLEALAVDPDRSEHQLGTDPEYTGPRWPHVRLYPLTYERLQLVGDQSPEEHEEESTRAARTRSAQLWIGLARAAMASEQRGDDAPPEHEIGDDEAIDPSVVASAIDSHKREAAYDQVIVGYMLQIADELKSGKSAESAALRKRVSNLVGALDGSTLTQLLEMGGDTSQRHQFLLSASEGMAVEAVVDLVRAASETEQQTISHSMLRMMQKLAHHADRGGGKRREVAETSVREQIGNMIRNWTLADPNPEAYREALQRMSVANPIFAVSPDQRFLPEPRRLFQMSLELDVMGDAVERAVDALVIKGETAWMMDAVNDAEAPKVSDAILARLANPEQIGYLIAQETIDVALLDRQLAYVGAAAGPPLIDALMSADSRQTRRLLMDRLTRFGAEVAPELLRRLDDERWFVRRNMLALIAELPEFPPAFDALPFLHDVDARVRREALRILVRDPHLRERAICLGLADADDHTVRLALTAATRDCPESAVPLLVSRATGGTNADQRVTAIRALAARGGSVALETLIRVVAPRKGLFGTRPPAKSPEYIAALGALHDFTTDARARAALALAARSRDPDIAQAALGAH